MTGTVTAALALAAFVVAAPGLLVAGQWATMPVTNGAGAASNVGRNDGEGDRMGAAVALSRDGTLLAAGSPRAVQPVGASNSAALPTATTAHRSSKA